MKQAHHPGGQWVAPSWMASLLATPLRRLVQPPEKILHGLVLPGQTVADLGAGPGFFTLPMARMVGATGRVLAVDLQAGMLEHLARRAEQAGVRDRIELVQATPTELHVTRPVQFALALYMVHEVPEVAGFMSQVAAMLAPGGRFLIVEPYFHVSRTKFAATVALAEAVGLREVARPRLLFSHAVVVQKPTE